MAQEQLLIYKGRVSNSDNSKNISNAYVFVSDVEGNPIMPINKVTTDVDGNYSIKIPSVDTDKYLAAGKEGYELQKWPLSSLKNSVPVNYFLEEGIFNETIKQLLNTTTESNKKKPVNKLWIFLLLLAILLILGFFLTKLSK